MRAKLTYTVVVLLIAVGVGTFYGWSPQKRLAHRLKNADRVVVTYPADGFSMTVMGEEVNKVVEAIAAGKKESPLVEATPYLQFQFFRRDECLDRVTTSAQVFWIGHKAYTDPTGTLEALMYRYREKHPPMLREQKAPKFLP